MHGVVTVLAEPHYERVEELWRALKRQFGVSSPRATAVPHFSYHISPLYHLRDLKQVLLETAVSTPPFTVKTTGIGIFPGDEPVVYIPVARTPELQALHNILWPRLQYIAPSNMPESHYYTPSNWFPHITLGHSDINADNLGPIVTWLNGQSLAWEIQVTNLTLLYDKGDGSPHIPLHRTELQGS